MTATDTRPPQTIGELLDVHYRAKLEVAKKIDPGIGHWIEQQLAAGCSPEYVHDTLKVAVAEARRQKAGAR